jgi:hypothetical protein
MKLPKKKYLKEALFDDGETMDVVEGQFILDSEGMKQLADELERVYYKASEKNNQDFMKLIRFLRGDEHGKIRMD